MSIAQPPPPPPPPPGGTASAYPVVLDFERGYDVKNWRVVGNWILAIPHLVLMYALGFVSRALTVISFFSILFTRRIPDGIFRFQVMVTRYSWRVGSYVGFMRNEYPAFSYPMVTEDDNTDPARLSIVQVAEYKRWAPLYKWFLALPHIIVLVLLALASFVVWIIAFFAVLFTGKYPRGLRDFVIGVSRWANRVQAYAFTLLTDEYPPFSLR